MFISHFIFLGVGVEDNVSLKKKERKKWRHDDLTRHIIPLAAGPPVKGITVTNGLVSVSQHRAQGQIIFLFSPPF